MDTKDLVCHGISEAHLRDACIGLLVGVWSHNRGWSDHSQSQHWDRVRGYLRARPLSEGVSATRAIVRMVWVDVTREVGLTGDAWRVPGEDDDVIDFTTPWTVDAAAAHLGVDAQTVLRMISVCGFDVGPSSHVVGNLTAEFVTDKPDEIRMSGQAVELIGREARSRGLSPES